eukprot:TRINITY_DN4245_c0_g1_i1.p1 TRINITY_DN4245_c0_g1~~TRINITY_DN4245_c0_g1_i1.p1  ORF type:complete len:858 (+),score=188.85 TRINITY_DN4245_c0_g1_i1:164-2737(+)
MLLRGSAKVRATSEGSALSRSSGSSRLNVLGRGSSSSKGKPSNAFPPAEDNGPKTAQAPLCGPDYRHWLETTTQESPGSLALPSVPTPVTGLANSSNMCYLNSVVQSLVHTPMLQHYITLVCPQPKEIWLAELCSIKRQLELCKGNGATPSVSRLANMISIESSTDEFRLGAQADAHEAFMLILTKLLEGCVAMTGEMAKQKKLTFAEKEELERSSLVGHVFGMDFDQRIACNSCSYSSKTSRVEYCLCISTRLGMEDGSSPKRSFFTLPGRSSKANPEDSTTIVELLQEFTKGEPIDDFRCEKCSKQGCTRSARIGQPPNVLVLHVYRRQGDTGRYFKRVIRFQEKLDLAPFSSEDSEPVLYELFALIVFTELNRTSGHYISYVRDGQGGWYQINDAIVKPVSWSFVRDQEPYMLFYAAQKPQPPRVEHVKKVGRDNEDHRIATELLHRGLQHFLKKEFDAAQRAFTEALARRPDDVTLLLERAKAQRQLRCWNEAEADAAMAVELDPTNPLAHYARALAQQQQGKIVRALATCNAGLKLDPNDKGLLTLKTALDKSLQVAQLKKKAEGLIDKKDLAAASEAYGEAMKLQPKNIRLLHSYLAVLEQNSDWKSIVREVDAIGDVANKNPKAACFKAKALRNLEQFAEAVAACDVAVAEAPTDEALLAERAVAQHAFELFDAKATGEKALDDQDYPAALAAFSSAAELGPEDADAWLGRARAYARSHQWDAGEADAQQALQLGCRNVMAFTIQVFAQQQRGALAEALDVCRQGLAVDAEDSALQRLQVVLERRLAEAADAAAAVEEAEGSPAAFHLPPGSISPGGASQDHAPTVPMDASTADPRVPGSPTRRSVIVSL